MIMGLARLLTGGTGGRRQLIRALKRMTERDWDLSVTFNARDNDPELTAALNEFIGRLSAEITRSARSAVAVSETSPSPKSAQSKSHRAPAASTSS